MAPMTVMPTSRAEVIAAVRDLATRRPMSPEEMSSLAHESAALAVHIQKRTALHDVPEAIWHFLCDADIRFKDPKYADIQLAEIASVLEEWSAAAPSNTSFERTRGR
jgi:hypothetical protein